MASSFSIPSYKQILQQYLNDYISLTAAAGYNNGLGLPVDPGSEPYLRFATNAGNLSVLYALVGSAINSMLVSNATGPALDAIANDFGLFRRSAVSAQGFVQLVSSVPQTLILGSLLTGPNSLQYQVATSGVYNPGANVPVVSVSQGAQTNLPIGSIMNWASPLTNMQSTCLVSIAITGGADAENDNTLRNRVYLVLQSPPQMGNGQNMITLAGSVDGLIQQPFVYSNFNGSGTQLIALTSYQTTSYIGRDLPHLPSDGYINLYGVTQLQPGLVAQATGYGTYNQYSQNTGANLSNDASVIYGQMPGPVANPFATVITTVNNKPSEIAAVLTLPYPVGTPTNGFGNGWMDSQPWPNPDGVYVTNDKCFITAVQGPGTTVGGATGFGITVKAPSSGLVHTSPPNVSSQTYNTSTPTAGSTHIQWVNRSDAQDNGWTMVTATILGALDNGDDTWNLSLDTPLVFPTDGYDFYGNTSAVVGDYISPASINGQNYLTTMMEQYALLGPGQATASQGLIILGASRYPSSNAQFPTTMGVQVERALVTNNQEVYAASVNPQTAFNQAYNPPDVNAPPNIYIPRNIAFYPTEWYNFGL
jgi:Baseplate J-like protein